MPNFSLDDAVFVSAAQEYPTPFYLYDERGIRQAARALRAAFAWNAGFCQFFAVKALPNPAILRLMLEEGCGLDCSSLPELRLAQMAGAKGEDIMFSANAMPAAELEKAKHLGAHLNLDDLFDVQLLLTQGEAPAQICLRVNPGPEGSDYNTIMGGASDAKFGMRPDQLETALQTLAGKGLRSFGLHAMTMSNTLDGGYYARNAAFLLELGKRLARQTGLAFSFINLSGGLGIPYHEEDAPLDLKAVGAQVQKVYKQTLGQDQSVRIYTELGRLVTGPYGWLVSRAIHQKSTWREYIGLDATAANLMRPAMYGAWHHVSVVGKREAPRDKVYDLTGALCENNDKFAIQRALPQIDLGDLVLLHDVGAHGHAMGYQYNGRLRSAELLYTQEGQFRLIRRAETAEDYLATLVNE